VDTQTQTFASGQGKEAEAIADHIKWVQVQGFACLPVAEFAEHGKIECWIGQFQPEEILPINAGAHRSGLDTLCNVRCAPIAAAVWHCYADRAHAPSLCTSTRAVPKTGSRLGHSRAPECTRYTR
jgi:hypothetical protein